MPPTRLIQQLNDKSSRDESHRLLLQDVYRRIPHNSQDPRSQNGAVVFYPEFARGQGWVAVADGYNRVPDEYAYGVQDAAPTTENKGFYLEHAERNAIYKATSVVSPQAMRERCMLVCPWFACADCARTIAAIGPRIVVGHRQLFLHYEVNAPGRWTEQIERGMHILEAAGVQLWIYDGSVFDDSPYKDPLEIMSAGAVFRP